MYSCLHLFKKNLSLNRLWIQLVSFSISPSLEVILICLDGFVNYVTQAQAQSEGLLKTIGNQVYIGVDNTTQLDPNGSVGRNSVRLQSNPSYNHALVIADFAHIPGSDCGAWPAL